MTKDSPISDMYPESAIIERDGKNTDWQGIVLISFVEPRRIIEAVGTTTMFTPERDKIYRQTNNIVIIRDSDMTELNEQKMKLRQFLDQKKQQGRGGRGGGRGGGNSSGRGGGDRGGDRGDYRGGGRGDYRGG